MTKRNWGLSVIALGLWLTTPALAESKSSAHGDALARAEHAYQEVDFPSTREQAERALEAGSATPEQTARLHVLLGISAAALGNTEDSKQHFVAALAVDPTLRLDKSLSPKIRGPYLEAQGYWSAAGERLDLRATPTADLAHLVLRMQDPASLVSKIELRLNAVGSSERSLIRLEPAPTTRFAIPAGLRQRDYEYVARALDRYGNVLAERGSDADPELVKQRAPREPSRMDTPRGGRSYLLPAALAVTGLGAVATGIVFNVKREQAAHEWNGPSCENPGRTRQQQCESVDTRVTSNESLAIGFYAGGGALLAGSVISLLAGRAPAPTERATALGCRFVGTSVSCLGQF